MPNDPSPATVARVIDAMRSTPIWENGELMSDPWPNLARAAIAAMEEPAPEAARYWAEGGASGYATGANAPVDESEAVDAQIERLAFYITERVPGEPSQSQGAVDTAIRIMEGSQAREKRLRDALEAIHTKTRYMSDPYSRDLGVIARAALSEQEPN